MFPILLDCMAFDHLRMRAQVTVNTVKLVPNHKCMVTSDIGSRNNWIDNCQVGMGHIFQHSRSGFALRPRRERPRGRAAEERDEIAPFHRCNHSITSSARASSVGGTSRPRALAVLRLITNSYLVGACTGKSAGFSPLRMRST